MSDRFFTFMIVPERSDRIRKLTLPTWLLRVSTFFLTALAFVGLLVLFDYLHMLSQVAENKRLRVENHLLKMEIQGAKNKVEALDQSVNRLKVFAQKLRVISNLDQPGMVRSLQAPPEGFRPGTSSSFEDSGIISDEGNEGGKKGRTPPASKKGHKEVAPPPPETEPSGDPQAATEPEDMPVPGRDADVHSRLEYQRSKSLATEFGEDFDTKTLTQQVSEISMASVQLREIAEIEEQNLVDLQEQLQDRAYRLLSTPSILPTQGYLSSAFGSRYNPFSGVRTFHAGMDIANSIGTAIHAPADGKVVKVGFAGGFGTVVKIDHGYGVVTAYGHLSRASVQAGQRVKRGDKIAEMGNSGRSTGPHLHYQVEMNGKPVEPRLFILDDLF